MGRPKGSRHSEETRHKMSISQLARQASNPAPYKNEDWLRAEYLGRQQTIVEIAGQCGVHYGTIYNWLVRFGIPIDKIARLKNNPEWRKNLSKSHKGKRFTEKTRQKMSRAHIGMVFTEEHCRNMGLAKRGSKSSNWQGGKTEWCDIVRRRAAYAEWRTKVFERDDYTCQGCGQRGVYLEAHHEKLLIVYPELMYDVDNGKTLCLACHRAINHQALQKQQEADKTGAYNDTFSR